MKITGFPLIKASLYFFFLHREFWYLMAIALISILSFVFFVEARFFITAYDAYIYEVPRTIAQSFWQIWVVVVAYSVIARQKVSLWYSAKESFFKVISVWWLVGWFILLQWSKIPLNRDSFLYSDDMDLFLALAFGLIYIAQLAICFFMIPMIASGEVRFKKLIHDAWCMLKKNIVSFACFFLMFFLVVFMIFYMYAFVIKYINMLARYFGGGLVVDLFFRMLLIDVFVFTVYELLGIAQALSSSKK